MNESLKDELLDYVLDHETLDNYEMISPVMNGYSLFKYQGRFNYYGKEYFYYIIRKEIYGESLDDIAEVEVLYYDFE